MQSTYRQPFGEGLWMQMTNCKCIQNKRFRVENSLRPLSFMSIWERKKEVGIVGMTGTGHYHRHPTDEHQSAVFFTKGWQ